MDYVILKKGDDAYNLNGACASHYLQEIEITILEIMYDYLVEQGLIINNVCVLCSDGIMIQDKYYSSNLLKNMEEAIYNKSGFKLKLSTKGLTDGFSYSHIVKNLNDGYITPRSVIKINSQFLTSNKIKDYQNNMNTSSVNMDKQLYAFMRSTSIKSLSVKSPYGSGKTFLLKKVMEYSDFMDYNKKILYLSYRKTLTMDLLTNFKRYGFVSYQDTTLDLPKCDRLIIQVESLHKIEGELNNMMRKIPI
jgi:hypothetical protein